MKTIILHRPRVENDPLHIAIDKIVSFEPYHYELHAMDHNQAAGTGESVVETFNHSYLVTESVEEILEMVSDKPKKRAGAKKFVKPTMEEGVAYCRERNNGIDFAQFFNHYASKGWMIGKNPMKSWKACIRTWEDRSNNEVKKNGGNRVESTNLNHIEG